MNEKNEFSCNTINNQLQFSSWAQILQLHQSVILLYLQMFVKKQNNTDTERLDACPFKFRSSTYYTFIQKILKELFLQK